MPELPEVETVRLGLARELPGERVLAVDVLRPDSIGFPDAEAFASRLPGHKFESVLRRGKYLLISLDNNAGLAAHLRMSGRLLIADKKRTPPRHLRVRIRLASGRELHFEDMRVFGRLWYIPPGKNFAEIIPALSQLGVEPLTDLTPDYLEKAFANRTQSIKAALLDQTLIAGIGNIYADESLFQAGISPLRSAKNLRRDELALLSSTIRMVLERAIELGGSSIRDYTDSLGVNGNYQHYSLVYGRQGEPCRQCTNPIERVRLAGRSTHFCKKCQPRRANRLKLPRSKA